MSYATLMVNLDTVESNKARLHVAWADEAAPAADAFAEQSRADAERAIERQAVEE